MNEVQLNPFEAPESIEVEEAARFRLRRWFALALYLSLIFDLTTVWILGFHPLLVSIATLIVPLVASAANRKNATIWYDDKGIHFKDLVQIVNVPWVCISRVAYHPSKTQIETKTLFAQITVSSRHFDYDSILQRVGEIQAELGFSCLDLRTKARGKKSLADER